MALVRHRGALSESFNRVAFEHDPKPGMAGVKPIPVVGNLFVEIQPFLLAVAEVRGLVGIAQPLKQFLLGRLPVDYGRQLFVVHLGSRAEALTTRQCRR